MKTGASTSRDFITALKRETPPRVESFVTTVEQTKEAIAVATRPSYFERKMDAIDASGNRDHHIGAMFGNYLGAVLTAAVRGHGAMVGEISASEARDVLAAGYDKLEGLEKQLVGHMLTRVRYGADNSFETSPLGYDVKSAQRFTTARADLAALPAEQLARLDALANKVEGALSMAWSATHGYRTAEQARADIAAPPAHYSADAKLPADELQAITDYGVRVFDVAYAHARSQKQQDELFSKGR